MKCKYQVRLIQSKGALLVLLWVQLIYIACFPYYMIFIESFNCWFSQETRRQAHEWETCWLFPNKWLTFTPILIACLSAPAVGWMADATFGHYKVFKTGVAFLFLYSTLNCLLLVFEALFWENNKVFFSWIYFSLYTSLLVIGNLYMSCYCSTSRTGSDA